MSATAGLYRGDPLKRWWFEGLNDHPVVTTYSIQTVAKSYHSVSEDLSHPYRVILLMQPNLELLTGFPTTLAFMWIRPINQCWQWAASVCVCVSNGLSEGSWRRWGWGMWWKWHCTGALFLTFTEPSDEKFHTNKQEHICSMRDKLEPITTVF